MLDLLLWRGNMATGITLKNMSTNKKLLVSSGVPLLFLIALTVIIYYYVTILAISNNSVNHTYRVIGISDEIIANATDMETGMRGFLLTGNEAFLAPYVSGSENVFKLFDGLQKAVSNDALQVERLKQASEILNEWQQRVATTYIGIRREIGNSSDVLDISNLVANGTGKKYFDSFRTSINQVIKKTDKNVTNLEVAAKKAKSLSAAKAFNIRLEKEYSIRADANRLLTLAVNMETGMRGFLLAGNEDFLEPYHQSEEIFFDNLALLKEKFIGDETQLKRLASAGDNIIEWRDKVVVPYIELRREIGDNKTLNDLADLVSLQEGKAYFDNFRFAMDRFKEEEKNLIVERVATNDKTIKLTYSTIISGTLIAVFLGAFFSLLVGRAISEPVVGMTDAMARMANGDLDIDVPGADQKDEIGKMATAMETFRENTIKARKLEQEQHAIEEEKRMQAERLIEMAAAFNNNIGGLLQRLGITTHELQNTAYQLNDVSSTASEQSTHLNEAAESSSNSVSSVASTAEQLSSSIHEINNQVVRAEKVSKEAMDKANIAQKGMTNLEKSSEKIGNIVSLIQDIAGQTNLLALNATIEAARAGDAGKGFAVVAHEVKSLASQTAKATSEISEQINATQDATNESVDIIKDVVKIINEMHDIAAIISSAVEEQSVSMGEIVDNAHNATNSAKQVYASVDTVRDAARHTNEASQSMGKVATHINDNTVGLQQEIQGFISGVASLGFDNDMLNNIKIQDIDYETYQASSDDNLIEIATEEVNWLEEKAKSQKKDTVLAENERSETVEEASNQKNIASDISVTSDNTLSQESDSTDKSSA